MSKYKALMLLLLLGFIWGTGYSIARYATTNGVSPLGYSFWQSLGPALLITFFAYAKKSKLQWDKKHLWYYFICGLTGIAIPNTNMYFAAPHLPAGLLAVVVNTVPIIAYPFALYARVEAFNFLRLIGVLIGFCGLLLIIIPKTSLPSAAMIPWIISALITPLSFAFCAVYISRFRPDSGDSFSLAAGTLLFSSLLLIPLVIFSKQFYSFNFPLTLPDWVILLEILLSSIGYILFFKLIKLAGPVYYSLVDTIVALTGLFWGFIIFNEKLNPYTSSAILLILFGLLLVSQYQHFYLSKKNV